MITNRKQLAKHLEIHPETLTKLLDKIGIQRHKKINHEQMKVIFQTISNPIFFKVTRIKLARLYRVHPETLSKCLKENGIKHSGKLTITDLNIIYKAYRTPISFNELFRG